MVSTGHLTTGKVEASAMYQRDLHTTDNFAATVASCTYTGVFRPWVGDFTSAHVIVI